MQRLAIAWILLCLAGAASAQQLLILTSPNGGGELFGHSVAVLPNGNIVVGAVFGNPFATGSGRVYVFDPDGCDAVDSTCDEPVLQIDPQNPSEQDFGAQTATTPDGDILIGSQSRVLVFDGSDAGTTDEPEHTIDVGVLDGGAKVNAVATMADGDIVIGVDSDRVFVFDGPEADEPRLTIVVPGAAGGDLSVHSLAVSGNRIVAGTLSGQGGRIFLFDGSADGTNDTPLLTIEDPTPGSSADGFGENVAVTSGGDIVVGARLDDTGTVYIFDGDAEGTTSAPILTLKNPDHFTADGFGNAVASTPGGHIIVGADVDLLADENDARDAGSAFVFDPDTCDDVESSHPEWPDTAQGDDRCEVAEITINNPFPDGRDLFGKSVASLADGTVVIGAPQDSTGDANNGNVFLFEGPAQDDDGGPGCFSNLQINVTDPRNLIIVGTSLVEYLHCAGFIPSRPVADRICVPECFDDPTCHDDGCPYPFLSVDIDPIILRAIDGVLAREIDEATFNESLRESLAANRTTLTNRPAAKARSMTSRWAYALATALLLIAVLVIVMRLRASRR